MASGYNLTTFLRQTPKALLHRYFQRRHLLDDIDFDALKKTEYGPILEAMEAMPAEQRLLADRDFQDIYTLANKAGTRLVIDIIGLFHPEVADRVEAMENHYERAMWLFLEHNGYPDDFYSQCLNMARFHALGFHRSKRRRHLPMVEPRRDDEARAALAHALSTLYRQQGRGHRCYVTYHFRPNPDRHCFLAYPEDYATSDLQYDGLELRRLPRKSVFDVAFIYRRQEALLEICAPGSRQEIDELMELFCQTILGKNPLPSLDSDRCFNLNRLLEEDFAFTTRPPDGIDRVEVAAMRVRHKTASRPRFTVECTPCPLPAFLRALDRSLTLPLEELFVDQVRLKVYWQATDRRRAHSLTFSLNHPDSTNLEDLQEHLVIKHYLGEWGLAA
jgi:hypothetical protein